MIDHISLSDMAERYVNNMILRSDPLHPRWNVENFLYQKPTKWNYIDGCIIKALLMYYNVHPSGSIIDYARKFADSYIDKNCTVPTMNPLDFNLDNINSGKYLLTLFKLTGDKKYLRTADWIYDSQLRSQPRLKCGNFWHKAIYPHQVWLDGAYMALPFIAEYSIMKNDSSLIDDVLSQIRNIRNIMRDDVTGLYYHGYDESRQMNWADDITGLSPNFWLRSIGWLAAGLADICEILPDNSFCRKMLSELVSSMANTASADGMLMQLPALPGLEGNYPETSGSLLFAYAALRAARLGISGKDTLEAGKKALSSTAENFISIGTDGIPVLRNICLVGGLGKDRSGSCEYYLNERITENDGKGIAPFLMAYSELTLNMLK